MRPAPPRPARSPSQRRSLWALLIGAATVLVALGVLALEVRTSVASSAPQAAAVDRPVASNRTAARDATPRVRRPITSRPRPPTLATREAARDPWK